MDLYSIKSIREILGRHGFHFSKSLGQNFLTEKRVCEQIAELSGIDRQSGVLEIGPGMGGLTRELSARAAKVTAIEIDRALLPVLSETLNGLGNVHVVNADIMKADLRELVETEFNDLRRDVCANLPYYITTPVLTRLIESHLFNSITVMLQKEVAERICAAPGSPDYGAFSVFIQYYTIPEILFEVPAECFVPQPKVDSAVIRLQIRENPPVVLASEALFFQVVRAAFAQRRKLLSNGLSAVFHEKLGKKEITDILLNLGFSDTVRGETLGISDFANIANEFDKFLTNR